jgi:CsoR family transcriptional regulator, copper-sensing transcriptional repressor
MQTEQRINRIIGQLKGILKMVDSQRSLTATIQQLSAVKSAIDSVALEMSENYMNSNIVDEKTRNEVKAVIKSISNL